MTLPRFAVAQCGCINEVFPKTTVSTLLSVIFFTGAISAHKRHQGYNYSYHWVQNSDHLLRIPSFNTILLLFIHVNLSNLRPYHFDQFSFWCYKITKKKIVFMSHRLAAFRSQRQWIRILISLTTPMAQLGFNRHRESHCSSKCSRKPRFRHYYLRLFLDLGLYHLYGC